MSLRQNLIEVANKLASTVAEKNEAYGDAFKQSGDILKILYPNGCKVEDFPNLLFIVRILDKLFRVSKDPYSLNEDAPADIAGYALLKVAQDRASKE